MTNTDEKPRAVINYLDRTQKLTSIKDDNEAIADELFSEMWIMC